MNDEILKALTELKSEMTVRFDRIDARLDRVETRLDSIDTRLDHMDARFDRMENVLLDVAGRLLASREIADIKARLR